MWYPGKDCLLAIACKLREAQLKLVKLGNAVYDNDTLASVACDTPASVVCDTQHQWSVILLSVIFWSVII